MSDSRTRQSIYKMSLGHLVVPKKIRMLEKQNTVTTTKTNDEDISKGHKTN